MRLLSLIFCLSLFLFSVQSCKDACEDIDCGQNGICVDGTCECDEGYLGTNCERTVCDDLNCGPNGTCNLSTASCDCDEGYSGTNCENNVCDNIDCGDNGTCDTTTGACLCNEGYEGNNCEDEIRAKHFGTYTGDLTGCIPIIIVSFIPADDLEALKTTPLEIFASDQGVLFVTIGSMSAVLDLNVEANITEEEFLIPAFGQTVDVGGQSLTIDGMGTGTLVDENTMELNLDLVFDLGAAMLEQQCTVTFVKE